MFRIFYAQFHYAFYLLDTDRYIEFFCKNQEKPELQCNGKCSLNKVTEESSEKQGKIPEQITSINFLDFIPAEELSIHFTYFEYVMKKNLTEYASQYSFLFFHKEKQPPQNLMI